MEQLLNIALVSPFFLTLAIFTVAIVFAPPVKNEIALATEHEHEEMDHARSSSPEMVAVLAPGLGSERDGRMDEDQYVIEKMDEGSIQVRDLTRFEGVVVNEPDSSDPTLQNQTAQPKGRHMRDIERDDIAPVAVFLASDESRWVTDDTLAVSGGL